MSRQTPPLTGILPLAALSDHTPNTTESRMCHGSEATDDLPKITGYGSTNRGLTPRKEYCLGQSKHCSRSCTPSRNRHGFTDSCQVTIPCRSPSITSLVGWAGLHVLILRNFSRRPHLRQVARGRHAVIQPQHEPSHHCRVMGEHQRQRRNIARLRTRSQYKKADSVSRGEGGLGLSQIKRTRPLNKSGLGIERRKKESTSPSARQS